MNCLYCYCVDVIWIGNCGIGIDGYCNYSCNYVICVLGKLDLVGLFDFIFCGDVIWYNLEDMLVVVLFICYMLFYLYMVIVVGVVVIDYCDNVEGMMVIEGDGGYFIEVVLCFVVVIIVVSNLVKVEVVYEVVYYVCFIVNFVNFLVCCELCIVVVFFV